LLLGTLRQIVVALGDVPCRRRNLLRDVPHVGDDARQMPVHRVQGAKRIGELVVARNGSSIVEPASFDGLRQRTRLAEGYQNASGEQYRYAQE